MYISINGNKVEKSCVTANHGMNFGQFRNETRPLENYQLCIEKNEFIELFEKGFIQARDEIKADDQLCNETSEFSRSDYANLEQMFAFQEDLAEIIRIYIERKLFEVLLPVNITTGYVINSIDSVNVTDTWIYISGRARRWPANV